MRGVGFTRASDFRLLRRSAGVLVGIPDGLAVVALRGRGDGRLREALELERRELLHPEALPVGESVRSHARSRRRGRRWAQERGQFFSPVEGHG